MGRAAASQIAGGWRDTESTTVLGRISTSSMVVRRSTMRPSGKSSDSSMVLRMTGSASGDSAAGGETGLLGAAGAAPTGALMACQRCPTKEPTAYPTVASLFGPLAGTCVWLLSAGEFGFGCDGCIADPMTVAHPQSGKDGVGTCQSRVVWLGLRVRTRSNLWGLV